MKKRKKEERNFKDEYSEEKEDFKNSKQFKLGQKHLIMIFFNTVISVGVYFYLNSIELWQVLPVYGGLLAGFGIGYVIYNRGFSREGLTVEMLPPTMNDKEKDEFIASRDMRKRKSKWVLTIIIPLLFTLILDTIVLFIFPYFERLFS